MASIAFVKALVLRLNHIMYCDGPREMQIPCEGSDVEAVEYWNPVICDGRFECYSPSQDPATTQADTIKTLRIKNHEDNNTYWVIIDPADDESKFTDNCNACCGATPDMTTGIVIPTPIVEEEGVVNPATGISTFKFPVPANPFTGTDYLISALTYNGGIKPGTAPVTAGYVTVAAVVTWLNTNASMMGNWSAINSDGLIQLVGAAGITKVGFDLSLEDKQYCYDLPVSSPIVMNTLTLSDPAGNDIDIPFGPMLVIEANRVAFLEEMKKLVIGESTLVAIGGTNWKYQYKGPQKLKSLNDGVLADPFTVGPCV